MDESILEIMMIELLERALEDSKNVWHGRYMWLVSSILMEKVIPESFDLRDLIEHELKCKNKSELEKYITNLPGSKNIFKIYEETKTIDQIVLENHGFLKMAVNEMYNKIKYNKINLKYKDEIKVVKDEGLFFQVDGKKFEIYDFENMMIYFKNRDDLKDCSHEELNILIGMLRV